MEEARKSFGQSEAKPNLFVKAHGMRSLYGEAQYYITIQFYIDR